MKRLLFIFFACWCALAFAAHDVYQFANAHQRKQFNTLSHELRCLVCQNETLADSDARLAIDLRNIIYAKILHGNNNQQIIHYMVSRYGNFILFKPPLETNTYILWFAPGLFVLLALSILGLIIYRKR